MRDKPVAYFIGALNAFTTSQAEAKKEAKKYPVEALYPASVVEALKAENVDQKKRIAELEEKNGALRERIKKLEAQHKYRDHMDTVKF